MVIKIKINGEIKDAYNYEDAYYTIESNVNSILRIGNPELHNMWLSRGFNYIHTYIDTNTEMVKNLFGSMTPISQERLIWTKSDEYGVVKIYPYDIHDSRLRKICIGLCLKWLLYYIKKMNIPVSISVSYEKRLTGKRKIEY